MTKNTDEPTDLVVLMAKLRARIHYAHSMADKEVATWGVRDHLAPTARLADELSDLLGRAVAAAELGESSPMRVKRR